MQVTFGQGTSLTVAERPRVLDLPGSRQLALLNLLGSCLILSLSLVLVLVCSP